MRQIKGVSLWVGNIGDLRDLQELRAVGISAVVELALNEAPAELPRDMVHCRFPLIDGADNPPWLLRAAIDTIAGLLRANVSVLVCCGAGMSRSPSVAAGSLAVALGLTPADALGLVCEFGAADVSPTLWADVRKSLD